jgi:EAL domain-containing protein (putative c-di-GMP-specific phosphodiesterase class I)
MTRRHGAVLVDRIDRVIADTEFSTVFQPIVDLRSDRPVGYEALTRFADGTPPDRRFIQAAGLGLGLELEAAAIQRAIESADELPPGVWVSVNVSPALIIAGESLRDLIASSARPLVLELTEHVPVEDYDVLRSAIQALGPGLRYAIDDAGAGFASFRHIVELKPQFVKLNVDLVRAIDRDDARQAFVAGMVYFAVKTRCSLVAEGIETRAERAALQSIGVGLGQGYLLGRPAPAAEAVMPIASVPARRRRVSGLAD